MGQQEIFDFLKDNEGKWFSSRDIADLMDISIGSVTMSLKKLRKTNMIKYKRTGKRNSFYYTFQEE